MGSTPKQMLGRQVLVTLPETLKNDWPSIRDDLGKSNKLLPSGEFPLPSIGVDCLVYKVPEHQHTDDVIKRLNADPRVMLAQENQVFEGIQSGENDPLAAIGYGPQLIHADAAHRIATGKGIRVAVVDTGAEKEHPDLKGRLQLTANFVDGGDISFNKDRHGTAIAGVIGARANDGIGIYGIAPDAEVSVLKACWYPETGAKALCSSWSLAKAIDAAISKGAQVINLSLAGPSDKLLGKLLEAAHKKGVNIVAATLENKAQPGFPAELPLAIPVIAADPNGLVSEPSWLARYPDTVVAPGVEILTTVPKEGYDFVSGSSLAAAHVSGIVALLLELKPDLTPDNIKAALRHNGKPKSPVSLHTLDVCAILQSLELGGGC
jgi:subtilisin family serine protease